MTRFSAALTAFQDPDSLNSQLSWTSRAGTYNQAWYYYRNLMFSRRSGSDWTTYLSDRELYKHTRLIYNPVPQIVDFYVDNLLQSADHDKFPSLVCAAVSDDDKLLQAIGQLDQWSNWLSESQKVKRYAAATGNVLIEVIDDTEREKVTQKTIWPGYVTQLELSDAGDVLSYTIEYDVYDQVLKRSYKYKKQVDKEWFSYFRDDAPFIPAGKFEAKEENPYGFCPAVWIKHTDDGADFGLSAVHSLDKIDNVNSLASHVDDYIHKAIESPKLISAPDGKIEAVIGGNKNKDGTINATDPRLNWVVLMAQSGASVHDLSGLLKLTDASPELDRQLKSFSDDYPELQAQAIIKENSQLSGAALERLLTPAQNRLDRAAAGYDQQIIKLRQMQIAVAGWRSRNGWTSRTKQQSAFAPFDLNSYSSGALDFSLKRSRLISETESETLDVLVKKAERANQLSGIVPVRERIIAAGYSEERADELMTALALEDAVIGSRIEQ